MKIFKVAAQKCCNYHNLNSSDDHVTISASLMWQWPYDHDNVNNQISLVRSLLFGETNPCKRSSPNCLKWGSINCLNYYPKLHFKIMPFIVFQNLYNVKWIETELSLWFKSAFSIFSAGRLLLHPLGQVAAQMLLRTAPPTSSLHSPPTAPPTSPTQYPPTSPFPPYTTNKANQTKYICCS